jgi:hypothetical protein
MGWTFLYNAPDKSQVIEECTRGSDKLRCIRKASHGSELWTIWEDTETKHKTIVLFLLARKDRNWGYKDMTEAMHPYYYQCPLSFLDEVPVANEDWREKVRKYHKQKKQNHSLVKKIKVGSFVTLRDSKPNRFRVISLKPFLGTAMQGGGAAVTYKLVKSRIIDVEERDELSAV